VNALRGDKAMFFASNHERTMSAVKTIVAFNKTLPDGKKLLGIKFDVEPYGSQEWKAGGDQRSQVMRDYLSYLNQVLAYPYNFKARRLKFLSLICKNQYDFKFF
jgi:hypothetical protein